MVNAVDPSVIVHPPVSHSCKAPNALAGATRLSRGGLKTELRTNKEAHMEKPLETLPLASIKDFKDTVRLKDEFMPSHNVTTYLTK